MQAKKAKRLICRPYILKLGQNLKIWPPSRPVGNPDRVLVMPKVTKATQAGPCLLVLAASARTLWLSKLFQVLLYQLSDQTGLCLLSPVPCIINIKSCLLIANINIF